MFRRARHQQGSLQCVKRKTGQAVWEFRWYEPTITGGTVYRKKVIGTTEQYKTESQAQRAADALRLTINAEQTPKSVSIAALVEHYRTEELSADNQGKKRSRPSRHMGSISRTGLCRAGVRHPLATGRQNRCCRELAEIGAAVKG